MHISIIKHLILYLIAILFVIFNLTDIKSSYFPNLMPFFDVMMIFYFTIYRNGVFGFWFIFLLGIWSDALSGLPIGMTAFCYILTVKLFYLLNQKLMIKENFWQILEQFIAFISCILLLKWIILSIYNLTFYNVGGAVIQVALSAVLYIIMHKVFDHLSYKLLGMAPN